MLATILIVVIVLALVGAFPRWPHARSWGYGPSGLILTLLIMALILWALGILPGR